LSFSKPSRRLAPQQQTVRLYPDHTDGEQELQPDKRQRFSTLPEPASTQLLSSNTVYCVRPSQPPQLHVPDRREQLLHRNKLPPRQDRVLQATLASWIELRARADPKGRRSTVGACRLGRFRVLGRSRLCTLHPPTPAIRHASQTIHLMLYTALSIVRKLRVQVPCRRS